VVTICLGAGVIAAAIRRSPLPARLGFAIVVVYLLFGVVQRERAAEAQAELAAGRGHVIERARVMPTIGNLVLWRSVYEENGSYHVDAVRVGIFAQERIYQGDSLPAFDADRDLPGVDRSSVLFRDVERFRHFTQDWMAVQPGRPDVLGDVRYAILPDELRSLWGIALDLETPDEHADFMRFGGARSEKWDAFWMMLRGKALPGGGAVTKEND
jgi:inner membrane protein